MTQFLISFGADAMDHIPAEDMGSVATAAHAVVRDAIRAGVYVHAGGLEDQPASIVDIDGTVTEGSRPEAVAGLTIVDVASRAEALEWAAKIAVAGRCAQEVRIFGSDPELDAILHQTEDEPNRGSLP
jgi:hypothetical protein